MANKFSRVVKKINVLPQFCHSFLLTKVFCSAVKYANTSNVRLVSVTNNEARLIIANKKKVQNHIGGVHAIAAALLSESATGIVFGMNVPDSHIPLLKSMKVDYNRRMQGDLTAVARLTNEQIALIQSSDKGDIQIPVIVTDESGQEPIEVLMNWAWVSKHRK